MLANLCVLPTQPYSRHEKRCWRSCMHRSTITRLPSGASISRSTPFRSGAFRCGVGTAHGCTRRFLRSTRAQRRPSVARPPWDASSARRYGLSGLGWDTIRRRPSPSRRRLMHPGARALSGLLSRFASLRHAISRVSRFPVAAHPRLRAAPCAALRNTCLSVSHCA